MYHYLQHSILEKKNGYSGEILSTDGPIILSYDATGYNKKKEVPALVCFVCGNNALKWSTLGMDKLKIAIVDQLVELFGEEAKDVKEILIKNWLEENWSRGCYVGIMTPGTLSSVGDALRSPVGRIHWAGTETSSRFIGYMEGAVLSGERVANEVLHLFSSKSRL